jgi:RNA polymerase sigma factor (sigma-70 family)
VIADTEHVAILRKAMDALMEDHRRVLQLRYLEGLSAAEVAGQMHRSEPAIHMLTRRALAQLGRQAQRLGLIPDGL